ncbi:MAG TPA: hypothetical protein VFO01_18290 [Trebonia sp.]|nr:hypothetical protein [Trebonia sp.]
MRKLRTRIAVGAAVATFAGAAAFAAVSVTVGGSTADHAALTTTAQTAATAKTGTTLSIAVRKSAIQAGRPEVISGTLATGSVPDGRRIVELYRYNPKTKKWFPARVNFTRKGGSVRFMIRPLVTAQYELVYHGNAKLAPSHSTPVTVTVTT